MNKIRHGIIFNPMHNGIRWHNFIYVSIDMKPIRAPRKIINKRTFIKFNHDEFILDASEMSFHEILNMSTDQLANNIETKITKLVNKHAPFKNIRVRPTRKPWITR